MKPTPARQRREAHRTRKALGRALHNANMARASFGNLRRIRYLERARMPTMSISKGPLRKHRAKLLSALLRA